MKIKSFVFLFIILLIIIIAHLIESTTYQALEITDDCKIGIDINKNGSISDYEYFEIKGIRPFCSASDFSKNEKYTGVLNENAKIYLKQTTIDYYKKLFLNSYIRIDNDKISVNYQEAAILLLKSGLALAESDKYKKYENFIAFEKLKSEGSIKKYYLLNLKSYKYHKLNCKKGMSSVNKKYVTFEELPDKATPCKYCLIENKQKDFDKEKLSSKYIEKISSDGAIKIIEAIGAEVYKPSNKCFTNICKSLKNEIDNAKISIDMAVYDFRNQPELVYALINAKNRGVKIKVATDKSFDNNAVQTASLAKDFAAIISDDSKPKKYSHRLMHNKFFIFDDETVWTGSTNITDTGITGFNTNSVIIIKSKEIAALYKKEFENFMQQKYHGAKSKTAKNDFLLANTKISVKFSPQDTPITSEIIPEIKNAKKYIYIPAFIITHQELARELINAKNRGVDIKIIIDATSARNKYSVHTLLRKNNIAVKTENFAGKMHMKSILIDDKIAFLGSMNLTKSGNIYNDENCIKIENPLIVKDLKTNFLIIWNKIPNIYLTKDPHAESFESIGSCFDGIDNDFDGLIDEQDPGCQIKK